MSKKVWNLMYVAGNPALFTHVTANASNPLSRAEALAAAEKVAANGWRVWVEHHQDGRRIFESAREKALKADAEAKPASSSSRSATFRAVSPRATTESKSSMQALTLDRAKSIYRAAVDSQASDAEGNAWWGRGARRAGQGPARPDGP